MTDLSSLARRHHSDYSPRDIARHRNVTVTVCVPTRDEETTIGRTVEALVELRNVGAVDQVLVADESVDGTPSIAEACGAEVVRQRDLMSSFGPVVGKGDAMWRSLAACEGEVICFVDGDSADFGPRLPCGLVGSVAMDGFGFAKGAYRRPFSEAGVVAASGGGRVTELTAKPLLRRLAPELLAFEQPLAGEIAAHASLLQSIPFATGYSVDVALLIDVWRRVGIEGMVEVDLDCRQNRHRPLHELSSMADEVVAAIFDRTGDAPDSASTHGLLNRPELAGLRSLDAQISIPSRRPSATAAGRSGAPSFR